MKIKKALLFVGSVWEALRFVLLFSLLLSFAGDFLSSSRILMYMWLAGIQLIMVAGFVFMAIYGEKYRQYAKLMALGKVLNIFPAVLVLVFETGLLRRSAELFSNILLVSSENSVAPIEAGRSGFQGLFFLVAVIALLDLLFLIFLLSYGSSGSESKNHEEQEDQEDQGDDSLPDMEEVTVEEE